MADRTPSEALRQSGARTSRPQRSGVSPDRRTVAGRDGPATAGETPALRTEVESGRLVRSSFFNVGRVLQPAQGGSEDPRQNAGGVHIRWQMPPADSALTKS